MPFELKKAEASYQRIINRVFREEIWVKIEVYMNDMIVNSSNEVYTTNTLINVFRRV